MVTILKHYERSTLNIEFEIGTVQAKANIQ